MLKGKTSTGFEYEISDDRVNNYELLEVLEELDESPAALVRAVKMLLGAEQTKALKDHVRTESGVVPADRMTDELKEIFERQGAVKNS
ncbi:hypothetical protein [Lacticaseibacillus absianus]|uniref:hypothetical protein n=1 Tax=Lacticaseibacillus absianus TaxID=2729623 RepID=UPI0015C6B321|nr:hypothetical protein [Lacticaseibacillus absianus]